MPRRAWLLSVVLTGCRPTPVEAPQPPDATVSGEAIHDRLRGLMELPRSLGDPRRAASIDALAAMVRAQGADTVVRHDLSAVDAATGRRFALTNVVGHIRPDATHRFILASHFDTRPWADADPDPENHGRPVPGANDGTSGIAVILELIPSLRTALPDEVGFTVLLLDGEELGRGGDQAAYCAGSRALSAAMQAGEFALVRAARFAIVLDMVGGPRLRVPIEQGSMDRHPALAAHVWRSAAALNMTAFDPDVRPGPILDDHVFLSEAGIPSILIIDHDDPAWHTVHDTAARVSPRSLEAVAMVVLRAVTTWPHWPRAQPPRNGRRS